MIFRQYSILKQTKCLYNATLSHSMDMMPLSMRSTIGKLIHTWTAISVTPHAVGLSVRSLHSTCTAKSNTTLGQELPYPDGLSKLLNPVGYLKWKMNVIDNARANYEHCSAQFEQQPEFVKSLGLDESFQGWFSMTILHVWILNARLRGEGANGKDMKQEVFNHIWLDVEIKLHQAGVKTRISQITSGLLDSYYGQTLAYDEGIYYGDSILAAALWRNFFGGKDVNAVQLLKLIEYTRRQLVHVEQTSLDDILSGKFQFLPASPLA
ncbi:Serine carboxypeptidase 3 [Batrachochytrium dendrobatidis]|nr:Serine carboxypeptidase 3 [Batrachochytrium dendrobatidis]